MGKLLMSIFLICLLCILSACNAVNTPTKAVTQTPTPLTSATPQTSAISGGTAPSQTPAVKGTTVYPALNQCDLLNSRDLASLFSSAEVVLPKAKVSQVNHVIFSAENVSASESNCVYYAFHRPGQKDMKMLQVSYWVDIPNQATPAAWARVWKDANSSGGQAVSGIGGGALFENGRLTFENNGAYLTIEATGSYLNSVTSTVESRQIKVEKKLALDVLNRLGSNP